MNPAFAEMLADLDCPGLEAEHRRRGEILRSAAQAAVDREDSGQSVDPYHIVWALQYLAANKAGLGVDATCLGDAAQDLER